MDKLVNLKQGHYAKYEEVRAKELHDIKKTSERFKAKLNPFKNHDTAESIEKFLALEQRDKKRNLLFNFMAEKRFQDIILPTSLFDAPIEQQNRIARIIQEENKKMRAAENDQQKLDRMKREVEVLVEQGFTFKQPLPRKVKFTTN